MNLTKSRLSKTLMQHGYKAEEVAHTYWICIVNVVEFHARGLLGPHEVDTELFAVKEATNYSCKVYLIAMTEFNPNCTPLRMESSFSHNSHCHQDTSR